MNRLPLPKRVQILHLLVEGASLRAAARIADVSSNTVAKLLIDLGTACQSYQNAHLRKLPCTRIQVDEIWSFCYARNRKVPPAHTGKLGYGDIWTWVALDPDTKLVPTWLVGDRGVFCATLFMNDLALRLKERVQITSDGHKAYPEAIAAAFNNKVDYARLIKDFADPWNADHTKIDLSTQILCGKPDPAHISTSMVERQNLTMRTNIKRFARKTNAHSKKIENHAHAVALHFMWYNYCRIHQSLRVTPAMAAGVSDRVWSLEEVALLA